MSSEEYHLRWGAHSTSLCDALSSMLADDRHTDVIIAAEGSTVRAHKIVLSACSSYFEKLFSMFDERNQIVILKDTSFRDVLSLVEFMYRGEARVAQQRLASLLATAENLKIRGLTEVLGDCGPVESPSPPAQCSSSSLPMPSLQSLPSVEVRRKRGRPRLLDAPGEPPDPCFTGPNVEADDIGHAIHDDYDLATGAGQANFGIPQVIIKMKDYLLTGSRHNFWEENFVKDIMQAVRRKDLDMKRAAELLGVSYGTLYGRYRETFGYLKHGMGSYMVRPTPADSERMTGLGRPLHVHDRQDELREAHFTYPGPIKTYFDRSSSHKMARYDDDDDNDNDSEIIDFKQEIMEVQPDINHLSGGKPPSKEDRMSSHKN